MWEYWGISGVWRELENENIGLGKFYDMWVNLKINM